MAKLFTDLRLIFVHAHCDMGHRNIQLNSHMIDLQADQGHHSHLHREPCIVYTNIPNYHHQNINFHPIPERHENPLFYSMPQYNSLQPQRSLDLNAPPPSSHYNNPYLMPPSSIRDFPVQINLGGTHDLSHGLFKRKNAEGTSSSYYQYQNSSVGPSSTVGPISRPTEFDIIQTEAAPFVPPEYDQASMTESESSRSVRNRAGLMGTDSVLAHSASVMQGSYIGSPIQLPGNPWLDMNFGATNGDIGALTWAQPTPNLPYLHANVSGACIEAGNTGVQGYQVSSINRGAGFVHHPIAQSHPNPPTQGLRGFQVNHLPQMAMSSRGIPMIRYSNASVDPFQDVVDARPTFVAPVPPTGFQMYRPHGGEIVLDPSEGHRPFPHLRVLPEDEVALLEIPGYHVSGESVDQHSNMRLDIDHMSYEELLALGEQIGSVATGLSEGFVQDNLRTRTFTSGPAYINLEVAPCPDQEMINFCIVCQTDYEYEESIGMLDCGHEYHKECIKKWLVVKNTCPVCKSTALRGGKGKDLAINVR
ncbi:hypothetical protein OROGR_015314 [Orobanche gracilis]